MANNNLIIDVIKSSKAKDDINGVTSSILTLNSSAREAKRTLGELRQVGAMAGTQGSSFSTMATSYAGAYAGNVVGNKVGSMAGTMIGGTLGRVLGSVVPIVGTLIGGMVGEKLGEKLGDKFLSTSLFSDPPGRTDDQLKKMSWKTLAALDPKKIQAPEKLYYEDISMIGGLFSDRTKAKYDEIDNINRVKDQVSYNARMKVRDMEQAFAYMWRD